jgi:hypothetical protein
MTTKPDNKGKEDALEGLMTEKEYKTFCKLADKIFKNQKPVDHEITKLVNENLFDLT